MPRIGRYYEVVQGDIKVQVCIDNSRRVKGFF